MNTFLAGKSRRLYKTLICPDKIGIAPQNRTAQRMSIYASQFGFLRALHLSIFEQPINMDFFNNTKVTRV
ncbi:MAG: hypothetical protein CVU62_10725 [Deltaproteobacteria bacterium HGW-Deltaproteobacteria-2]|jgi:hypothetical protein|nr:MAG: hypothetical protein CVU62_10725 [Deltaproteobacteria bacterium HGW-Deltaproteobacteria-2]